MYKSVLLVLTILILTIIAGSGSAQIEDLYRGDDDNSILHHTSIGTSTNLISKTVYEKSGSIWIASQRFHYSYDQNDSLIEVISQMIVLGNWSDIYRTTYTYDPSGRIIEILIEKNMSVDGWTNESKKVYSYAINPGPIKITSFNWINSDWVKSIINFYQRNSNGDPTEQISISKLSGNWTNTSRYTYFYGMNGLLALTVSDLWTGDWSTVERSTNNYNSAGNLVETLRENLRQGNWHNAFLDSISYDTFNRKIYHVSLTWSFDALSYSSNWTYTYGIDGNLNKRVSQKYQNSQWEDQMMIIYSWDVVSSVDSGNVPQLPATFLLEQNYPNPFNPTTSISFSISGRYLVSLSIFNILGYEVTTLVNRQLEAGTHTYEWNGLDNNGKPLSSGVFFYRLTVNGYSQTRKMLLVK